MVEICKHGSILGAECPTCVRPGAPAKPTAEDLIRAAARELLEAALRVLEGDGHVFGSRPCQTCQTVSSLAGRPFGCSAFAARRSKP